MTAESLEALGKLADNQANQAGKFKLEKTLIGYFSIQPAGTIMGITLQGAIQMHRNYNVQILPEPVTHIYAFRYIIYK